jgi:hypothetical protein
MTCSHRVWYSPIQEKLIRLTSIAIINRPRFNKKPLGDLDAPEAGWE